MPRRAGKLHNLNPDGTPGPGHGGFWIEAAGGKRRHVGSNDDPRPQWQGHEARLLERLGMQDSKSGRIVYTWDEIQPVDEAFLNTYVGRP